MIRKEFTTLTDKKPKIRDIEFRGLFKKNEWAYGGVFSPGNPNMSVIYSYDDCNKYPVYAETIGQYIGKKDKNNKKIFEDDILKVDRYPFLSDGIYNYLAQVYYDNEAACFYLYAFKSKESKARGVAEGNNYNIAEMDSNILEVIGNIHDNPELLERQ